MSHNVQLGQRNKMKLENVKVTGLSLPELVKLVKWCENQDIHTIEAYGSEGLAIITELDPQQAGNVRIYLERSNHDWRILES